MSLKLLVADDSATIQKIVNLAFREDDVVIESVSDGDSALAIVRVFKPDIVLADIFMPGCSGYQISERIKEDPELAQTPVVLLVGTFEPFDESEAARVKCDGHLTKPFDTSELIQMVASLVGDKMKQQKTETSAGLIDGVAQPPISPMTKPSDSNARGLVDPRVRESFVGSNRVLEIFDPEMLAAANEKSFPKTSAENMGPAKAAFGARFSLAPDYALSEDSLNLIVDRVVRRMSADVVREVAWEVVPELSEVLIRRILEERNRP